MFYQENKEFTLYDLNLFFKRVVNEEIFPSPVWVVAEISEMKAARTGHCYLELIDKRNEKIVAKSRATIWNNRCALLKDYFEEKTGSQLKEGIKVLFLTEVRFHEVYGLSLNIIDIDPSFTIGELAKEREEVIRRLTEEGVIDLNKEISLPVVIQRIAVISSDSAAGYEDFVNTLNNNSYGFEFEITLFKSLLQGDEAVNDIINALDEVYANYEAFDVLVIIRGGGSKIDLSVFDSYDLAFQISQFPLPVITGLGHTKDVSVVDLVAHTSMKTPTAAAEFIISHNEEFLYKLNSLSIRLVNTSREFFSEHETKLKLLPERLKRVAAEFISNQAFKLEMTGKNLENASYDFIKQKNYRLQTILQKLRDVSDFYILRQQDKLVSYKKSLSSGTTHLLDAKQKKLEFFEAKLDTLKPEKIFKRGYHLVTNKDGKIITDIDDLSKGELLKIYFNKGIAETEVKNLKIKQQKK